MYKDFLAKNKMTKRMVRQFGIPRELSLANCADMMNLLNLCDSGDFGKNTFLGMELLDKFLTGGDFDIIGREVESSSSSSSDSSDWL